MAFIDRKVYPADLEERSRRLFDSLLTYETKVHEYEDETAQTLARSVMPLEKLRLQAAERSSASAEGRREEQGDEHYCLLVELLRWFKLDLFSWVDAPSCGSCSASSTTATGPLEPSSIELRHGAQRVEGYLCKQCQASVRFPRFNDPVKLLETRRGRCGEWANAFVLCARAAGFETRFVLDVTDHVWAEVWVSGRWRHADPCENVLDRPLLYSAGWGKKLSYVFAFSADEVVDVSWRYDSDHAALLNRRQDVAEIDLISFLKRQNEKKLSLMTVERREELARRRVAELVEFISPQFQLRQGAEAGRASGSLEWRRNRGELGAGAAVLRPEAAELTNKQFLLTYDCGRDEYHRPLNGKAYAKFESLANRVANVFRKEEFDWKMAYLARQDGASADSEGTVEWLVDLSSAHGKPTSATIEVASVTFETGQVVAYCVTDKLSFLIRDGKLELSEDDLDGSGHLLLRVTLSGGRGRVAWQHAQLFRTGLITNCSAAAGLRISVRFN